MLIENRLTDLSVVVGTSAGKAPYYDNDGSKMDYFCPYSIPDVKGPPIDMFGYWIFGAMEFISPAYSPQDLFGIGPDTIHEPKLSWNGLEPIQSDLGIPVRTRAAGAIIRNTISLFSGNWNQFSDDGDPGITGENPVSHYGLTGSCTSHVDDRAWHRQYEPEPWRYYSTTWFWNHATNVNFSFDTSEDFPSITPADSGWDWSPQNDWKRPVFWAHRVDLEELYGFPYVFNDWATNETITSNMEMVYEPGYPRRLIRASYSLSRTFFYYDWKHVIDYDVSIEPVFELLGTKAVLGTSMSMSDFINAFVRYEYTFKGHKKLDTGTQGASWETGEDYDSFVYNCPSLAWLTHTVEPTTGFETVLHTQLTPTVEVTPRFNALIHDVKSNIDAKAPDTWPSVFYAAEDATSQFLDSMEANHLENLTQLGIISDLIEPIDGFQKLLRAIRKKDPYKALWALLDLLSTVKLLYSYGIAPTKGDAEEIASRSSHLVRDLKSKRVFSEHTFNGKFSFEVPGSYYELLDDVQLVARAKVRGSLNPHSFLAALLPIRAFGLMPSLSAFWDLLPFSFVADWFFNIGRRLEDVDTSVEMLALQIKYCTTSMKIYWPIPDEILALGGCTFEGEEDDRPQVTYYLRAVSSEIPPLSYSTLDFRPAQGVPDIGLAFALLFKLFG